jgi:hypothetical protein
MFTPVAGPLYGYIPGLLLIEKNLSDFHPSPARFRQIMEKSNLRSMVAAEFDQLSSSRRPRACPPTLLVNANFFGIFVAHANLLRSLCWRGVAINAGFLRFSFVYAALHQGRVDQALR